MRIVIDMQGAQSESRYRGIGRYTMAFAQAVVRNRGKHEIFLVLNGMFPDSIEEIRSSFEDILPRMNICVWNASSPVQSAYDVNSNRREIAESMREAFIASLNPDLIHIPSLFEGYLDDSVTSIGRFDKTTLVTVTLHDLIPLLSPDDYLKNNIQFSEYYYRKLQFLEKANTLLAISESSRNEAISCLGVNPSIVVNTYEGVEDSFCKLTVKNDEKINFLSRLNISKPYVLYTGGADERKNLPRLIKAYSELDNEIRNQYCLVFAGKFPITEVDRLKTLAKKSGLKEQELVFTGYISEEALVMLYNLCTLYVFPSWHEGFGLPVLEAMACGAPVIGSNTASLPEVIGLDSALFDPYSVQSITEKIHMALSDENYYKSLCDHANIQVKKFSWDNSALTAISVWERLISNNRNQSLCNWKGNKFQDNLINNIIPNLVQCDRDLRAEIAIHLSHNEGAAIRRQLLLDISELCQHDSATGVQRVVRSYLHHLLLSPPPGFDVFPVFATPRHGYRYANRYTAKLLNQNWEDLEDTSISWQRGDIFFGLDLQHHVQLAHSLVFHKLREDGVTVKFLVYDLLPIQLPELFKDGDAKELHEKWLSMIALQDEAICISKATADAYQGWIQNNSIRKNERFCTSWVHIGADLEGSKPSSGVPGSASEILSFLKSKPTFLSVSTIEPRKAQDQILDAFEYLWEEGGDYNLVFVGREGWKVDDFIERINNHPENGKRFFWLKGISDEYLELVYKSSNCLIAASLNEGFGLPLIEAGAHQIPVIARDIPVFREVARDSAFYFQGNSGAELAGSIKQWLKMYEQGISPSSDNMKWNTWRQSTELLKNVLIEQNYARKQLLVDISELVQRDAKSGIQRVVHGILNQWLTNPPKGYQVLPVYATVNEPCYRYARCFSNQMVGLSNEHTIDEPVDVYPGDMFVGLDLQPNVVLSKKELLHEWRNRGVHVWFVLYDLLPILLPECFPTGADKLHAQWLSAISEFDGVACISKAVAAEYNSWLSEKESIKRLKPIKVEWFHLGADGHTSGKTLTDDSSISPEAELITNKDNLFLMVGTLEPRKGHSQVLDALELLWNSGVDASLVIIGKEGWMVEELSARLRNHPQNGKRLFWLEGASDQTVEAIYEKASCLISASYGEGFGLPLIEAAQHKLPIIARDIPVFREVAGNAAFYFSGETALALKDELNRWISLYKSGNEPKINNLKWLNWKESADTFLSIITK